MPSPDIDNGIIIMVIIFLVIIIITHLLFKYKKICSRNATHCGRRPGKLQADLPFARSLGISSTLVRPAFVKK